MTVRVFQKARERKKLGVKSCPWWIEWRDPASDRKLCKKIGPKKLAKEAADAKLAQLIKRETGVTEDKPWTEFIGGYDTRHIQTELTSEASRVEVRRVVKRFGEMMKPKFVKSIDETMLDQYVAKRRKQRGQKPGSKLSVGTIRKDIRTLLAALNKAKRWRYIDRLPEMSKVKGIEPEKRFVTEEHFTDMLAALGKAPCPVSFPVGFEYGGAWTPAQWWSALLMSAWITGMRRGALLALKWADVDLAAGTAKSRGKDNKGKRTHLVKLGPAGELLKSLEGSDARVFPWDHALTWFDAQLLAIQTTAGIKLPCIVEGEHECTPSCFAYSMHDFRRAHATYHYGKVSDRDLQEQMGHANFATTRSYAKYAKAHQNAAYAYHLPEGAMAKALKLVKADGSDLGGQREANAQNLC
ncbi:tyrosine-type recombinase/integrase [Aeoliella sp. SH292]|uniref:tyrosine-type recombinase/integrase n=1 Tax=Aeoliella sp. SH292 TaxID=3454464 RepID=UPI003F9C1070